MMESEKNMAHEGITAAHDIIYLTQKYDEMNEKGVHFALVALNIKNFRYFNTKYGIKSGNEILALVLRGILDFLEQEEYAAYLFSDNYGLLLKSEDGNRLMTERLVMLVNKLYRIKDDRIYRELFFSMGIYQLMDRDVPFQDALNYANLCRKESGTLFTRSSCLELYDQTFYHSYMDRMELETQTAEAYKNYEFVTYLQPKVDLKTERIIGAEALIRWFDKNGNSIPLYKFLPILNQNGYIALLDIDTFEQMCNFLDSRIKNNQKVVPISFNISKTYFYDPNLLKDYTGVFEKFNIPKHLIEIELMESISLNDTEQMKKVIAGFKDYGFDCALDDFGNGYSSFNVLLNAQLDIIKMDRQFFVSNLNGNREMVIKTIVDLIHSLNMKVIAEGVEKREHIDWLKECACDYVQGYYYYRPMSVDDFEALLDSQEQQLG